MQKINNEVFYSASDLVSFLECDHSTTLDLQNLITPMDKTPIDEQTALIAKKGDEHERAYLRQLDEQGITVVNVRNITSNLHSNLVTTLKAMQNGAEVIYQGALQVGNYIGFVDFLVRVEGHPSKFGSYSYKPVDTKLSRTPKAKAIIQLAYYGWLLSEIQGAVPLVIDIVLGTRETAQFRYADSMYYFLNLKERFETTLAQTDRNTYPDPTDHCNLCHWKDRCSQQRLADDHLSQVANISKSQIIRLKEVGISTLKSLASTPERPAGTDVAPLTYQKLQLQAALQQRAKDTGQRFVELIDRDVDGIRGLYRLPEPNEGDMFFDMEGNPLEEGGLEYLFGVYLPRNKGKRRFKAFWAHTRQEEKIAFEKFIDFVMRRLKRYPNAHIYHYAPYERTAMEKLMSIHGTREAQVDNLFRLDKFIDLYQVVREGIRVSEPRYSIKNIEKFYLDKRTVEVTNAAASIVYYERWKETRDAQLLQDIEDYNYDDVRSTYELLMWLLPFRDAAKPWANAPEASDVEVKPLEVGEMTGTELRLIPFRMALIDNLPEDRATWTPAQEVDELTFHLLDFYRREAKPEWWSLFSRKKASVEDLINDAECLADLTADLTHPPEPSARSIKYSYWYPPQDTKLRTGSVATRCDDASSISNLEVIPDENRVTFTLNRNREAPPLALSIGPGGPISAKPMVEAMFRYVESRLKPGPAHYAAIEAFLARDLPSVKGIVKGQPLVPDEAFAVQRIIDVVANLQSSYVFLQGPPGAGKTYTASHIIATLLDKGFKVGITSNSHHAINNLLTGVEAVCVAQNIALAGVKKSTRGDGEYQSVRGFDHGDERTFITNAFTNDYVFAMDANLIAGTAWLFSLPDLDQELDYLFIEEAGQVSLANLVAVGTSAKNLVLLGDQMQLSQPSKGIHPGISGGSSLDYLLQGLATIPSEKGIFLKESYRMHPDVCGFISEAMYDGRLQSHVSTKVQHLVLNKHAHPVLRKTGIQYLPVSHVGCAQDSEKEAEAIVTLVDSLLTQHFVNKAGNREPITLDNILVVTPYNMQVNRLKRALPSGARVGTVDKFQGQEAEVVLVSMVTSDSDTMPRNLEFLFSKNRLNVAVSRAKCLAVMVASPGLMSISCKTPEQLNMVNTMCWATSSSTDA